MAKTVKEQVAELQEQNEEKVTVGILQLKAGIADFLEKYGGLSLMIAQSWDTVSDSDKKSFLHSIEFMSEWALKLEENLSK